MSRAPGAEVEARAAWDIMKKTLPSLVQHAKERLLFSLQVVVHGYPTALLWRPLRRWNQRQLFNFIDKLGLEDREHRRRVAEELSRERGRLERQ
jgi:hypothetical protein